MGSELEFNGTLANVCEYLEILSVFDEKVGALLNKIKVTGLECDSRRVTKGTIFYAKKGLHYNPFEHLDEIKAKGAVAVLIDAPEFPADASGNMVLPSMNFSASYRSSQSHDSEANDRLDNGNDESENENASHNHSKKGAKASDSTQDKKGDLKDALDADDSSASEHASRSAKGSAQDFNFADMSNAADSQAGADDVDKALRSGRKVILEETSSPDFAVESYHATTNTPEAQAIADANLFRLVLPCNRSLSAFAGFIYGNPSHKLKLIGVTGTNGKSTITNLIAQMLNLSGHRCALFGTLGFGFLDDMQKSANTTLDAISLQRELAHYQKLGADYAVLEVSSIGFCENRVSGLRFYGGAFSNLSQDHLDYHKTMEDYFHAKLSFLRMIPNKRLVVNRNRETGRRVAEMISNTFEVGVENHYFDKRNTHNFLNIKKVNYKHSTLELLLNNGEKGATRTELKLMGHFNAENYAVALGVMLSLGFEYKHMASLAPKLRPITGRMECFSADYKPRMIVDYAHTPDGVEQALKAARTHMQGRGRIFAIVGCGGDRDKRKRPIMAMKASIYADYTIFTADNPRSEMILDIIDDMMFGIAPSPAAQQLNHSLNEMANQEGLVINGDDPAALEALDHKLQQGLSKYSNKAIPTKSWYKATMEEYCAQPLPEVGSIYKNVLVIPDRAKAIEYAFKHASAQDCIVVAGKGHEDYQILGDKTIHFSDRELCCKLLGISLPENTDAIVVAEGVDKSESKDATNATKGTDQKAQVKSSVEAKADAKDSKASKATKVTKTSAKTTKASAKGTTKASAKTGSEKSAKSQTKTGTASEKSAKSQAKTGTDSEKSANAPAKTSSKTSAKAKVAKAAKSASVAKSATKDTKSPAKDAKIAAKSTAYESKLAATKPTPKSSATKTANNSTKSTAKTTKPAAKTTKTATKTAVNKTASKTANKTSSTKGSKSRAK